MRISHYICFRRYTAISYSKQPLGTAFRNTTNNIKDRSCCNVILRLLPIIKKTSLFSLINGFTMIKCFDSNIVYIGSASHTIRRCHFIISRPYYYNLYRRQQPSLSHMKLHTPKLLYVSLHQKDIPCNVSSQGTYLVNYNQMYDNH